MRARDLRRITAMLGLAAGCILTLDLPAQRAGPARGIPLSQVDSLLAVGRLAAAERALYAAVEARPRAPEARGALAWYLASRARFVIADVLFTEALRFGANPSSVAAAREMIASYAARHTGPAITVPYAAAEDALTLGRFEVRGAEGPLAAVLDPNARGVAATSAAAARAVGRELWVGARRLPIAAAEVDPFVRPGELRVGLDVLLGHAPFFDERAGTLTLGATPSGERASAGTPIPMVLAMPGLWLVERPGVPPAAAESPRGRALLRGARWRFDLERSVVIVER